MNEQIAALEKRITDLEAELKLYKDTEWDRLYIRDMMQYVPYAEIKTAYIEPPTSEAERTYRADYYRRIVMLEKSQKRMLARIEIVKKQREGVIAKTAEEIDLCGAAGLYYPYVNPREYIQASPGVRYKAVGVDTNNAEIRQYEVNYSFTRSEAALLATATRPMNDTLSADREQNNTPPAEQ